MHLIQFAVRRRDPLYREFLRGQQGAYARRGHQAMVRFGTGDPRIGADELSCVAAVDDGRLVGGLRVHRGVAGELPSEIHLASAEVTAAVARARDRGEAVAELSGAWVAPEWQGRHLVHLLMATGIAAAEALGATALLGSCSARLMPTYERTGFRWRRELPLTDRPFPGDTSYFALDPISAMRARGAGLASVLALLEPEVRDGQGAVPEPVLRRCAERLGLQVFASPLLPRCS
ncbi:GNAT family N-acetyltransferase [Streptomyces sp. WAC06614]|uniref:GNAT family N-acetyltransferase n=1 Tax=Streptomyces sp. WAC06614 TaxID=2487416 RepID=UPI000F77A176|nr:GNAT family N-acetyltransferase [Streptomyces sp. WAC06614]RSS57873.1 GNAT family N-acetyltransferase [Streptomyces sp. WAC06614]